MTPTDDNAEAKNVPQRMGCAILYMLEVYSACREYEAYVKQY
jgi:hypothetical protein